MLQRRCGLRRAGFAGLGWLGGAARPFAGVARTVRYLALREDRAWDFAPQNPAAPFLGAYDEASAGEVLVIATGGAAGAGVLGEMLALRLRALGVAGVVCDGGMRDVAAVAATGPPVLCAGAAPASSTASLMLVDVGLPVECAGVAVFPGDRVVADADGALVCPEGEWEAALAEVAAREAAEAGIRGRVAAGAPLAGLYPPPAPPGGGR